MRKWLALTLLLRVLTMGSVGLNVTSLKWTGTGPEGSEALPRIPLQIEYNDKVQREADIGLTNEEIPNPLLSRYGTDTETPAPLITNINLAFLIDSSSETTQDIEERQKLQTMIPVRPSVMMDSVYVLIDWCRHRCHLTKTVTSFPHNQSIQSLQPILEE